MALTHVPALWRGKSHVVSGGCWRWISCRQRGGEQIEAVPVSSIAKRAGSGRQGRKGRRSIGGSTRWRPSSGSPERDALAALARRGRSLGLHGYAAGRR